MANWIDLNVNRYLTVTVMNSIYGNFLYLTERMTSSGKTAPTLSDCRVGYSISPGDIVDKFNLVEENINKFHELANYPDIYYGSPFVWNVSTDMNKHLESGVKRWVDWLNDAKKHIDGEYEKSILTDLNGKKITDKNQNVISVFKEW